MGVFQVKVGDDGRLRADSVGVEHAPEARARVQRAEAAKAASAESAKAFQELRDGLHQQNVPWVVERLVLLDRVEDLEAIMELERQHPKFGPQGRDGVLNPAEERIGELTAPEPNPGLARHPEGKAEGDEPTGPQHPEETLPPSPVGNGVPCPHCDLTFGSEGGLAAHLEAKHEELLAGPQDL